MTCGGGVEQETRSCTNPSPGPLGAECVDDGDGTLRNSATVCNENDCPGNNKRFWFREMVVTDYTNIYNYINS